MARLEPELKQPGELSKADIAANVEIGRQPAELMGQARVIEMARALCGLEKKVEQ